MQEQQNSKSRKKQLVPSVSYKNNIILHLSQRKINKKQLKLQGSKSKKKANIPNFSSKRSPKAIQDDKFSQFQNDNNLDPQNRVKRIQEYIMGKADDQQRKKFVFGIYRGVIYSLQKLKPPPYELIKSKQLYLNEATVSHKKFLLLDLDETLIYTERDVQLLTQDNKTKYKFIYRPHLFTFLEKMSAKYELYVFTAAQKGYATAVVSKLNKSKVYIKDILCREQCFQTKKGVYLKDLRIIQNRPLEDIVIIDNLVQSFGLQLNNGLPILQFTGSPSDNELLKMIPILEQLSEAEDVRIVLRDKFKLRDVGMLDRKEVQRYLQQD